MACHELNGASLAHCTFAFAALAAAATFPALGQVNININVPGIVQMAPPPPRYEMVPGPRPGQVWVQGRWVWNERDYVWQGGRWQQDRPDYVTHRPLGPGQRRLALGRRRVEARQAKDGKHGHDQTNGDAATTARRAGQEGPLLSPRRLHARRRGCR